MHCMERMLLTIAGVSSISVTLLNEKLARFWRAFIWVHLTGSFLCRYRRVNLGLWLELVFNSDTTCQWSFQALEFSSCCAFSPLSLLTIFHLRFESNFKPTRNAISKCSERFSPPFVRWVFGKGNSTSLYGRATGKSVIWRTLLWKVVSIVTIFNFHTRAAPAAVKRKRVLLQMERSNKGTQWRYKRAVFSVEHLKWYSSNFFVLQNVAMLFNAL
jgi:hypothetical protein